MRGRSSDARAELQQLSALVRPQPARASGRSSSSPARRVSARRRLVETFLDSTGRRTTPTPPCGSARGACVEQHGAREPYMPVLEALERLARRPDADRLVGAAAPHRPDVAGADALVARRRRRSPAAIAAGRPPRAHAARVRRADRGADAPTLTLVLVLEDLHWSDPVDGRSALAARRNAASRRGCW